MLLVLANNAVGSIRLPLPLEAADCSVAAPFNELPMLDSSEKADAGPPPKCYFSAAC